MSDILESGDSRFNIPLIGGDVVSVPRAGIIYVVGAVSRPGGFLMQNDLDHMTMLKMLSLAGGTTSTAKVKNAVILRKNLDTGKRDQVPVDLSKVMQLKTQDVQLQANDILFVPDSNGLKALHRAGDIGGSPHRQGSGLLLLVECSSAMAVLNRIESLELVKILWTRQTI